MFETSSTLALAIGVLKNEKHSHLILADLLDENGDIANATFARSPTKTPRKRLDLVLGLIPIVPSIWFATELVQNFVIEQIKSENRRIYDPFDEEEEPIDFDFVELESMRLWRGNLEEIESLIHGCSEFEKRVTGLETSRPRRISFGKKEICERLQKSIVAAGNFIKKGGSPFQISSATQVGIEVKRVAKIARESFRYRIGHDLNWQIKLTTSFLEKLMATERF